ncbi:MAG: Nif3-like dinuclear metal center hexameric protein [Bacillota bacterium]
MVVRCQTVAQLIEKFAPKYLAEDWDNIGLQIGDPAQEVRKIFVSLDLNLEVLDEALSLGADMLVVHHTPLFKPLKNIRTDLPLGRLIARIVENRLVLYTAHTNLDSTWGGVNDVLAQKLKLQDVTILSSGWQQKLFKLVVFVPLDYVEKVREAISVAGGGWIGNYSDCTFQLKGTGTFRPLSGTNPFIGEQGKLEYVEEIRLETIVPEEILSKVVKAMLKAHPYEEVAYDIYPLANPGKQAGLGRVGYLAAPLSLADFIELVKESLGISHVRYCGDLHKTVRKIALCGGSGASFISQAVFAGVQVLLTGDIKYHEAQEALSQDLALVDGGHFATEQPVVDVLADFLRQQLAKEDVQVFVSRINTDPFRYL